MKLYGKGELLANKALKAAVIESCVAFIIALLPSLVVCDYLIKIFQAKTPFTVDFLYLTPEGAIIATLETAIFTALYIASPFILYKLIRLKLNTDKKSLIIVLFVAFLLFGLGILFAYYALIPVLLFFLLGLSSNIGHPSFSVTGYTDFCIKSIIFSGIIFEFPVLLIILAKTDLIKSAKLMEHWKEAAIGAFILSVILTYSELSTFVFFAAIILLLYGSVILTAKIVENL
jgi:sec-independent protein translocase protein TatC